MKAWQVWREQAVVCAGSVAVGLLFSLTQPMERVELMLMDAMQRLVPFTVPDSLRVAVVAVDDLSYAAESYRLGKWPWPRNVYPPVIRYLARAGARVIGFDLYFPVESAMSPADDRALVAAVTLSGNTCHAAAASGRTGLALAESTRALIRERFAVRCEAGHPSLPRLIPPFPQLLDACGCLGHVNVPRDVDGVARRVPLVVDAEGLSLPALSAAMYLWDQGLGPSDLSCGEGFVTLGAKRIPTDRTGAALVRFPRTRGPRVSFSSVLHAALAWEEGVEPDWRSGTLPPVQEEVFSDRMVIIAVTASGLFDLVPTPLGANVPGVEVQAAALENILAGGFLRVVGIWLPLLVGVGCLLAVGSALRRSTTVGLVAAVGLGAAYTLGDALLVTRGLWARVALPLVILGMGTLGHVVVLYLSEGREKRRYRQTFSRYVSRQVVEALLRAPSDVKLKGEQREITVMFCDIRGFTTLSERKPPEEVVAVLDEFLSAMVELVFAEEGTLDKFLGDGMMVFYGAPAPCADHADRAVRTALAMVRRLEELNRQWAQRGWAALRLGVGINTGPAVVGSIGSRDRMEYTAIGDTVNTASRVQALNKTLGTSVLVTGSTVQRLEGSYHLVPKGSHRLRGREQEVEIFEVVGEVSHG